MAAKSPVAVARPAGERLREADIPINELARHAYREASSRVMVVLRRLKDHYWRLVHRKRDDSPNPLAEVCRDVVILYNAGATEAEVRGLELTVREVIDRCYSGTQRRDVRLIDADEAMMDGLEDVLMVRRRNAESLGQALTPEQLEEEADVDTRLASLLIERARGLRAEARRVLGATIRHDRPRPVVRVMRADLVGA